MSWTVAFQGWIWMEVAESEIVIYLRENPAQEALPWLKVT
ncbi:hypothetical protein B0H94_10486 [Salsuginibacillus halophilus]|uniref:Uncharacterized protein n=1 Tax=Salsuginibacillus halophilus TaxID=517424 RepID=A0A2P8HQJ4_9BACI|nr:hypothetical protein B0H94_10486 [Salsuginibacillus halophilus]